MKLQNRILLILVLTFVCAFSILEYTQFQNTKKNVLESMRQEAKNIRSLLMSTRRIYHQQFLDSEIPLNEKTLGFLPAHALSRISEDFKNWTDYPLSFNNVSERPRNPGNAADALENEAIEFFRKNRKSTERFVPYESKEGEEFYHFSTPIYTEKYCIKCHGRLESAPLPVRKLYTEAFDYKVGELRGIMSIKLPASRVNTLAWQHFKVDFLIQLLSFLFLFFILNWLLRHYITKPLATLDTGLQNIGAGEYTQPLESLNGELSTIDGSFEQMAAKLSEREEELKAKSNQQTAINTILEIAQRNIPVEEQLKSILDTLLSNIWLHAQARGAIYLVKEGSRALTLTVQEGYADEILKSCATVPFGECLCGRAAETGTVIFADSLDERHNITYDGIKPHGHYCVPIKSEHQVLGVLNLYMNEGHKRDKNHEEYLIAVTNAIAALLERNRQRKSIEESRDRFDLALKGADLGTWDWDLVTGKVVFNERWAGMLGYDLDEIEPNLEAWKRLIHPDDLSFVEKVLNDHLEGKTAFYATEHRMRSKSGEWVWILDTGKVFERDRNGRPLRAVGTYLDITERKNMEERLKTISLTDDLTGLYNRRGFFTLAAHQIKVSYRQKRGIYLLYADLDNLKEINDTYGHNEGDYAITDFSQILKASYRASDVVARLGGDEFAVIPVGREGDVLEKVIERLQRGIEEFNKKSSRVYKLSVSTGVALYDPASPCSLDDLVVEADKMMYREKRRKKEIKKEIK